MDGFSIYKRMYGRFSVQQTGFYEVRGGMHVPSPCWVWTGAVNGSGYAQVSHQGTPCMVYRQMYEGYYGPIPPKQDVDHRCYNTRCIRPSHLQAVTHRENIALRRDFVAHRDAWLARLLDRHGTDLLYPGPVLPSTYLATLWCCQSHRIPALLETIRLVEPHFHYEDIRRGKHGPKPSLFRIWIDPALLEEQGIFTDSTLAMCGNMH